MKISKIYQGDCLEVLKTLPDNSVDSVVTDPPYFLVNKNGSGFMNKHWDGIIGLWKYLWEEPSFVRTAEKALKSCQVVPSTDAGFTVLESASISESENESNSNARRAETYSKLATTQKKGSVRLLAITRGDLWDSLKELLPSLTSDLLLPNGENDDALFVIPSSLPETESTNSVVRNVTRTLRALECRERRITFTATEAQKISAVTGAMDGSFFGSEYTPETLGLVASAESTATEKKYSATISFPTNKEELTKQLTWLLFATLVTPESNRIQQSLIKSFFRVIFREVYRVLKPGGHVLAFAGTRTYQYLATGIEDVGFDVRDCIFWTFGSGFPKSHNLKGEWSGWGSALKPAVEPICMARKPIEGTLEENVLKWGVGGINIDECRVGTEERFNAPAHAGKDTFNCSPGSGTDYKGTAVQGRWPANLIHDGSEEVVELFPDSKSGNGKSSTYEKAGGQWGKGKQIRNADFGDSGSASRFFYCAKASKKERNLGCEELEGVVEGVGALRDGKRENTEPRKNNHPTVKPIALMEYLVKLVSRDGATVLDPFAGSGTTGIACKNLNRQFIGIEREEEYVKIARSRIENTKLPPQPLL